MPDATRSFAERVYALVARIPEGRVTTYGMIAQRLGMPHAARGVGWVMRGCPSGLPWHRVVTAAGRPGGEPSCERVRLQWGMLADEGIEPNRRQDGEHNPRIDLVRYGWDPDDHQHMKET